MGEYSTRSVLIYDNGLFCELAPVLARSFGRCMYYMPGQENAFPKSNTDAVGRGFPNVERVDHWVDHIEDTDLFVFPDIGSGAVQVYLSEVLGRRVWGSRRAEMIEQMRLQAKLRFAHLDIPIGEYATVEGFDALREYLSDHKDAWVKLSGEPGSMWRGDCETFHAQDPFTTEQRLRELEYKLGERANQLKLLVEEPIPDAVEIGYDCYNIDGQVPRYALWGIEEKSAAYAGRFSRYDKLPKQLRDFNTKIADDLKETKCRSWFGAEMRITKDGAYHVLDPLARFGSPPGELCFEMYGNLADIFWHGAEGKCIDPEPTAAWGAELLLHSEWGADNWQAVEVPKKFERFVKFRNATVRDGRRYVVPQAMPVSQVCGVIGMGKTLEEAIEHAKEVAGSVKGYGLDTKTDDLDSVAKTWESLPSYGVLS